MTLSIIIPTKNRHQDLLNTLESIFSQNYLPDEIVIVDQNVSNDVKDAFHSSFNKLQEEKGSNIILKYIHDTRITGLTQARNIGIGGNSSEITLFLDDDVIMDNDFILNIMEIYKKHPDIYGVSGMITNFYRMGFMGFLLYKVFMRGKFFDKKLLVFAEPNKYRDYEYIDVSFLPGAMMSYRSDVFKEMLFDENFIGYGLSEDFDFSFRVSQKYKTVITPKARLEHVCSDLGRHDDAKLIENMLLAFRYFYKKNLDRTLYNALSYVWLNAGYAVYGVLLALFKKRTDVLVGCFRGFIKLLRGEGCDFIKSSRT